MEDELHLIAQFCYVRQIMSGIVGRWNRAPDTGQFFLCGLSFLAVLLQVLIFGPEIFQWVFQPYT